MSVPAPHPDAASNPHDAYTQSVFRELPQARGFFRGYLPDEVQELFDWRTLRLETGNFLSDQLQRDFADLRFSIRFAGQQQAHRITLLFEHKHRVIYTTPRQLHRYISRQLEETPDGQPLPSICVINDIRSERVYQHLHPNTDLHPNTGLHYIDTARFSDRHRMDASVGPVG